ncbi:GWxTD domain-containing protein [Melioribacter sp. OK-6-Me]|uniref:GWxTD domain-containing protein n=1 Tax=unclassified Melioribacter TaxID=2627329 RepID=UPI003ED8E7C2
MKRFVLLFVCFVYTISAQVESSEDINISKFEPIFYTDFVQYKVADDTNKIRLDVFFQVPYANIQFVKKGNTFFAEYSLSVIFYEPKTDKMIFERIWKERISTTDFDETISKNNFNISYKSFPLDAGDYKIKCILEDTDSRKTHSYTYNVSLKKFNRDLSASDILLVKDILKNESGEVIVPNVSRIVTNKDNVLRFYYEIYSTEKRELEITYLLEHLDSENKIEEKRTLSLNEGINTVYDSLSTLKFILGTYKLLMTAKDIKSNLNAEAQKVVLSKITGLPNSITDIDKAIEQMIYIASPTDLAYIKEGKTYEERLMRFLEFWDKKKPNPKMLINPIMNEYYRRVEYANKNFKAFGNEGWRTDMGMIYITFGPPSYVERHPFDPDSKPYEIWDYYELNRSFVFIDQTGFGDYRLLNPDYSRWPGYRY